MVTLLSIVTEIAGAVSVKLSLSDFELSFADVATIAGALLGAAGRVGGGV